MIWFEGTVGLWKQEQITEYRKQRASISFVLIYLNPISIKNIEQNWDSEPSRLFEFRMLDFIYPTRVSGWSESNNFEFNKDKRLAEFLNLFVVDSMKILISNKLNASRFDKDMLQVKSKNDIIIHYQAS